jgi:Protein of unknown function (DUF3102)
MTGSDLAARSRAMDEARFPGLKDIKTHPALDCIPLMNEAEFDRLVWSIRKIGLLAPIVQDDDGRVLDGRCRWLACEIAGQQPALAKPKEPVAAYIFAKNIARRHLSLDQRAIIAALMMKLEEEGGYDGYASFIVSVNIVRQHLTRGELHIIDARIEEPDYPEKLILPEALLITRHGDIAERVGRSWSLREAYEHAVAREQDEVERAKDRQRLGLLRGEAPFLAAQVAEGTLTLDDAEAQAEEAALAPILAEHAQAIRALGRRMIADTIEIGRRLAECRRIIRRGWIDWLERELGLSDRGALNFIRVYELAAARSENFSGLDLPVSGLYLLARPSTPESVRDDVLRRAAEGEVLSLDDIKREIGIRTPASTLDADSLDRIRALLPKLTADEVAELRRMLDGRAESA